MNRKFTIVACVVVAGLIALVVMRGGKRMPHTEPPPRDNFSVTVDFSKTNNAAQNPKAR